MKENEEYAQIQSFLEDFFKKFFPIYNLEIKNYDFEKNILSFNIQTKAKEKFLQADSNFIYSLQLILGKIIRKKFQKEIFLDIDVNNEKEKRTKYLIALADDLAQKVISTKKEKTTPYLNPQERKIIYTHLSKRNDIIFESQGVDPQKKIVIKPK